MLLKLQPVCVSLSLTGTEDEGATPSPSPHGGARWDKVSIILNYVCELNQRRHSQKLSVENIGRLTDGREWHPARQQNEWVYSILKLFLISDTMVVARMAPTKANIMSFWASQISP